MVRFAVILLAVFVLSAMLSGCFVIDKDRPGPNNLAPSYYSRPGS